VPILASIPFASDGQHANIPRFNQAIEEIRRSQNLPRGPDLYAWFSGHPDELRDGIHPNERGIASINRLWAEAVDALYLP
jgi:lysophospholipase L1-like esterase